MNQQELDFLITQNELTWQEVQEDQEILGSRLVLESQDLSNLDFSNRNLKSCRIVNCILTNSDFTNSDISHAEFMGNDLRGANMNIKADIGTDYTGCIR